MPGKYHRKVDGVLKQVKRRPTYSGSELLYSDKEPQEMSGKIRRYANTKGKIKPMENNKMANELIKNEIDALVESGDLSKEAADRIMEKAAGLSDAFRKLTKNTNLHEAFDVLGEVDKSKALASAMSSAQDGGAMRTGLKRFGIGAGAAVTFVAAEEGLDRHQAHQTKSQMMDVFPDLKQEDPNKVDQAFNVLKSYAPTMTRDPFVAGSAVSKMVQYDVVDPATIKTLLETQKSDNRPGTRLIDAARQVGQSTLMG